jgi:hypothetical protein
MNVNPLPMQPTSDGAIPRCKVDDREGIQYALQERGCCICTSVASSTERKEGVNLFWNYVENLDVGVTRGRADTMGNSTWNRLCFPKNGVIAGGGIGQSDFMWHCRLLPNVRKCFQHAWGGDRDLITSFDECGAYRNPWSSFLTKDWRKDAMPTWRKDGAVAAAPVPVKNGPWGSNIISRKTNAVRAVAPSGCGRQVTSPPPRPLPNTHIPPPQPFPSTSMTTALVYLALSFRVW